MAERSENTTRSVNARDGRSRLPKTFGPCIYCDAPADGREHWIPRSLGRFDRYEPLLDRLCRKCNRDLGRDLDEEFAQAGPTGLLRSMLNLRSDGPGAPRNVFHHRGQHRPAHVARGNRGSRLQFKRGGGAGPVRHIVVQDDTGRRHEVLIRDRATITWLRTALKRQGISSPTLRSIQLESERDDVDGWLHPLLSAVFPAFRAELFGIDPTPQLERVEAVSAVSVRYLRAVVKVAYHTALKLFPTLTGREVQQAFVREIISSPVNPSKFVHATMEPVLAAAKGGSTPDQWCHVLGVRVDRGELRAALQFFLGPSSAPPVFHVHLGGSPFLVEADRAEGRLAIYYPETERVKYDGYLTPISGGRSLIQVP